MTQTTIAISAGTSSVSLPTIALPTVTLATPAITVTTPYIGIAIPSIAVETPTEALTAQSALGAPTEWAIDVALENESTPAPGTSLAAAIPTAIAPTPRDGITFGAERRRPALPLAASGVVGAVTASQGAADRGASSAARHDPRKAKPAPRWKPTDDASKSKAPASPPMGASASAAGAGGSPGGSLPIFLALPFVAVLLDLARRVALEHATWPSGHRRRVPDTPG